MARMDTVPTHQLHVLMQNLLNLQEQQTLLEVLQDYSTSRDVHSLVYSLKTLLDTPAKCQLVTLLRRFINKKDGATFDELFPGYDNGSISSGKLDRSVDVTSIPSPNASLNRRPRSRRPNSRRSHPLDLPAWEAPGLGQTRNIVIDLGHGGSQPHGLGFSIRGGAEHGIGVYVSYVDVNSIAEKEGLVPGDQLLYVNGVSFRKIAHSDAAKIIKSSQLLEMEVRNVGRVPGSFETHQTYTWVDAGGRTVSPPPEVDRVGRYDTAGLRKSGLMLLKDSDERKVYVHVDSNKPLGLMIRGGSEFGLGIYITGVDPHSVAEFAGIKGGDQLLDVNGHSFLDISHAEAVAVLKASQHMMLTIKDVGKLPYARTTYDHTQWLSHGQIPPTSAAPKTQSTAVTNHQEKNEPMFLRGAGSQLMHSSFSSQQAHRGLLEEQARQLLSGDEHATLTYYLQQYEQQHISVSSLALALNELLNTPAKLALKSDIRGLILAPDLADFDRQLTSPQQGLLNGNSPGEDSGVDLSSTIGVPSALGVSSTLGVTHTQQLRHSPNWSGSGPAGQAVSSRDSSWLAPDSPSIAHAPVVRTPPRNVRVTHTQLHHSDAGNDQQRDFDTHTQLHHSDAGNDQQRDFVTHAQLHHIGDGRNHHQRNLVTHAQLHHRSDGGSNHQRDLATHAQLHRSDMGNSQQRNMVTNGRIHHSDVDNNFSRDMVTHAQIHRNDGGKNQRDVVTNGHLQRNNVSNNQQRELDSPHLGSTNNQRLIHQTDSDLYEVIYPGASKSDDQRPRLASPATRSKSSSRAQLRTAQNVARDDDPDGRLAWEPPRNRQRESAQSLSGLPSGSLELVTLYKTQPTLGLAIEGGANTKQPLPRIISIQPGGSAHDSGGLKVGHLVLEVNGKSLRNLEHQQCAKLIAEAFKNKKAGHLELLVLDPEAGNVRF